ncbi:MAG: Glu-tRNA(Gln) amidotransferase subunit GatE [Nitrososphaerales archaeon]
MSSDQKPEVLDFNAIQLKVGLEIHQQLATGTKLFCECPPFTGDDSSKVSGKAVEFIRILRPASSELGEVDEAAEFESRREIRVKYLASLTTSCLVEADEEPPHPINAEALETALLFSLSLKSRIADEIHVMRKIVVDGSNTSGFQRTAVIALGGELYYGDKKVAVQTIGLEEDAARAVKEEKKGSKKSEDEERIYALDRLGTPLIEVALAPIEGSPDDAENAARTLGRMMRSTGRIARGLGTIRQDLNISVMNGNVVEVKGVQRLDQIRKVVAFEAARQKFFFDLAREIRERIGEHLNITAFDAAQIFSNSESDILRNALSETDGIVVCLVIKEYAGLIGRENGFHSRLGKELGAIAKTYGLGGVFHSDELPNYGITDSDISSLRNGHNIGDGDAFVLVAGPRAKTAKAIEALKKRLQHSTMGVTPETREASLEGETSFLRPRPGAARMYPETDIPLIQVSEHALARLGTEIPEPWEKQIRSFSDKFDLPRQLAEPLFDSDRKDLFERVVAQTSLTPRYVASVLIDTFLSLSREGVQVNSLKDDVLFGLFDSLSRGKFAKEALPEVLKQYSTNPDIELEDTLSKSGLGLIGEHELTKIVDEVISQNMQLIKSKGLPGAHSTLMGRVMQRVRGKADGKLVNDTLARRLAMIEFGQEKVNQ